MLALVAMMVATGLATCTDTLMQPDGCDTAALMILLTSEATLACFVVFVYKQRKLHFCQGMECRGRLATKHSNTRPV